MRLYVIGPVTGRENLNRKAFEDAKEKLWDAGYDVLIPHDVVLPIATHERAMRLSIKTMLGCDGVVVLSDWEGSKGAKLEHDVAIACGLHVHNFLIWMNRASSWAHRSPDYSDDDSSHTIRRRCSALKRGFGRAHPPHGRDERATAGGFPPDCGARLHRDL